ncbi:DUF3592 domain-containing protein [Haloarcula sediminis]|uniref:DUF3592 domain-containing protein n=1 Tax=Haloarcula sediminis TaxID=3111777 RepID=UPI002D778333|nr:DUF3592 domain-containing protein [Haloarcula sp. CK38]
MQFAVRETTVTLTPLMLIAIVLGVGIAGYGGYDYVRQTTAVDDAVAVETTVTDANIERSSGRRLYYRVTVEHTYRYRGTEYTSKQVFPGRTSPIYTVRADAERVIEPYESNTTTTAYVDPNAPARGFLERQTTLAPFRFVGLGGLVVLLTTLHAVGARDPGQNTELRPASAHEPTRYETLFGVDRGTVCRVSKRLLVVAPATLFVSLVATVALLYTAEGSSVGATDPAGIALLVALVAGFALLVALTLYGIWSFTEYRRLRERIPEPRPPSPFRHPSRLVTILYTSDGLDAYGRRVKLTGFALAVTGLLAGMFAYILVTAS